MFVAEKSGLIKVFASLTSTTPTVFADLSGRVDDYWDRGLLGMTLDPNFPTNPTVYVLYALDGVDGGTVPRWNDACPSPPGPTTDGCVISGRLSRLTASGNVWTGAEDILIKDWCQQFPSHSLGDLRFGADGALYVSGGDGASFTNVDYGQFGGTNGVTGKNPCGDPPSGAGGTQTAPTARGGVSPKPEPPPAGQRPGRPQRSDPPRRPDDRRRPADQPDGRQLRSQRPPDRRLRDPQPVPIHDPPIDQRGLARRRRLERLRGDQPDRRSDQLAGGQPGLAMLRGEWPAARVRGGRARFVRQPLPDPDGSAVALLRVRPFGDGRSRRDLPDRQLRDRRDGLLPGRPLPGRVRRNAVLRRSLAELHLGDAPGLERPARSDPGRDLRRRRGQPGRSGDGSERRPVLCRLRWRDDPPGRVRRVQPGADRRHQGDPVVRPVAVDRRARRDGLDRPRGSGADLLVGSRQRRDVRRFDLGHADRDVPDIRDAHGQAAGHRPVAGDRHDVVRCACRRIRCRTRSSTRRPRR